MTPSRFAMHVVGDVQPGDLWKVASVDPSAGTATFERVQAPPDQYRKPGDGLHPRFPDTRRVLSREEALAAAAEFDAALDAERDRLLREGLIAPSPFAALDFED